MTTRASDRRTARRYEVVLPLQLPAGRALTRDVSECGVYFETDEALAPGVPIHFSLVLGQAEPDARFRVDCDAEVVRVEHRYGKTCVAAHITSYRLERDALFEPGQLNGNPASR